MNIKRKLNKLKSILTNYPGVVVAFSGGVDSSLLLKVAKDVLENRVVAVTAESPLYPDDETIIAKNIARKLKLNGPVISKDSDKKYYAFEEKK